MNANIEVPANLDILLDMPVTLTVEIGSTQTLVYSTRSSVVIVPPMRLE